MRKRVKNSLRAVALVAIIAAVAAPVAVAAPDHTGAATPGKPAVVTSVLKGEGRLNYPVPQDDVRVSVDAKAVFPAKNPWDPTRSSGTFRIYHSFGQPGGKPPKVYWGDFKVDCLTTGGPTATVTGRLFRTSPGHPWLKELPPHVRMGASFYVPEDGRGPARVGLSGPGKKGEPISKCMAPAADATVIDGGYALKDKVR
ncbi:hypothetical protein [Streptomyces sp. NPDC059063]|uniref:hypothetical protein n=1 Tax=unclassified Streptomyces TaxID=2593676 RepID=UPI00367DF01E